VLLAPVIPPTSRTIGRFDDIAIRTLNHAKKNGRLPSAISDLPERADLDNSIKDGWGREIMYEVLVDGTVRLSSFGRDGKPGGEGRDRDIVVVFSLRDDAGDWRSEPEWTFESWQAVQRPATRPWLPGSSS
jgi:hypothetical protein